MKIVLAEKVSPATLAVFQQEPGWQIVTPDQIKNGLAAELADADALVVRSAVQADAKLLESAPKLRVIGRAGVGVDNIDTDAATRQGIVVMNTPGANAVAVAELTVGLMISLARSIPRANSTMHAGKWDKKTLQGSELRGKTLGIVGLGRIGLEVARRAASFGMHIIGYDPFVAPVIARENGVTLVPIDEIFKSSDYLTLHVGLTTQTEGLINQTSIRIMKKGIRIINCARGELIVEAALAEALKSGQVAGAALDVFHQEPLKDSPFYALDNVILSPHIAGATDEAQEAIGIQLAMQVRDYLKLGVVQNAVNLPSLSHEEYKELAPWIEMAERLGRFLSHATPGNLENIQITYTGRIASGKTDLVRNAAIAGIFSGTDGEGSTANRINAAAIAARPRHPHPGRQEGVHHRRRRLRPQARPPLLRRRHQRLRHRSPRQLAPSPQLRRHRHRGPPPRHPRRHPQPRRPRRHRPDRHHPGQTLSQHRELRPRPLHSLSTSPPGPGHRRGPDRRPQRLRRQRRHRSPPQSRGHSERPPHRARKALRISADEAELHLRCFVRITK